MAGAGISGVGVFAMGAGGFLVYTGIRNITVIDGLRAITQGKVPAEGPQVKTQVAAPAAGGGVSGTSVPPDPGRYTLGAVKPWVRSAAGEIGALYDIKTVYGWAAGKYDHPKGLALDFMTNNLGAPALKNPVGARLATYAWAHRARLGVTYVIWDNRIISVARAAEGWRPYSGDSRHEDHVHVSFQAVHTYSPPVVSGGPKAV